MRNTMVTYTYSDASNYKCITNIIIAGKITDSQIKNILDNLYDGEYFIPRQIGLPENRFNSITEADHCWFQITDEDFCDTDLEPTLPLTTDEFVNLFLSVNKKWNDTLYSVPGVLNQKENVEKEYIVVYRDNADESNSIYKKIDKIFSEESAYMILAMVIKAGYDDARIESIPAQKDEEITKVFLPEGYFLTAEVHQSTEYPGMSIFLNHKNHTSELIGIAEYNSDRKGIFIGNYSSDSDEPIFYIKYCDCPKVKNNMKKYWCVTTSVDDFGRITSAITDIKIASSKPENSSTNSKQGDIYHDWFGSEEEAKTYVEESKMA